MWLLSEILKMLIKTQIAQLTPVLDSLDLGMYYALDKFSGDANVAATGP